MSGEQHQAAEDAMGMDSQFQEELLDALALARKKDIVADEMPESGFMIAKPWMRFSAVGKL